MSSAATLPRPVAASASERPRDAMLLALFLLVSLLPVVAADIPAMVDYPNHLARMSILTRSGTAAAHPLYEVAWAPYPNLAMDLLVPPLARLVGVEAATKLFVLLSEVMIVGGAVSLARAARGPVLAAGLTACFLLSSMPLAFGFVNFAFALGLSLFALAAWVALAGRAFRRIAVHAAAVVALYFAHLFALGLYGFAIGVIELRRAAIDRPPLRRSFGLALAMAAPVALVGLLAGAGGGTVGGTGTEWHLEAKVFWLAILNGWSREAAMLAALLVGIPLCLAVSRGHVRLVGPGPWLAAGFGLLFLALPFRLFDTAYVDGRALLAAMLILPAFAAIDLPAGRARGAALALVTLACLGNVAVSAVVQWSYRAEYRSLLAAFEAMPRGARLLPADRLDGGDPPADLLSYPMYHAATLAVHTRDAFVPTLFASPGKQPLRTHPSLARLKVLEGGPVPWRLLAALAAGDLRGEPALAHLSDWTRDFDFLLLLDPAGFRPRPDLLQPVATGGRFALFRIVPRLRP